MGDVVNLRLHRKRADREAAGKVAEENRVRHGLTRAERDRRTSEDERARRLLDGKRLSPDPE